MIGWICSNVRARCHRDRCASQPRGSEARGEFTLGRKNRGNEGRWESVCLLRPVNGLSGGKIRDICHQHKRPVGLYRPRIARVAGVFCRDAVGPRHPGNRPARPPEARCSLHVGPVLGSTPPGSRGPRAADWRQTPVSGLGEARRRLWPDATGARIGPALGSMTLRDPGRFLMVSSPREARAA